MGDGLAAGAGSYFWWWIKGPQEGRNLRKDLNQRIGWNGKYPLSLKASTSTVILNQTFKTLLIFLKKC
jgi:hypothetical protein